MKENLLRWATIVGALVLFFAIYWMWGAMAIGIGMPFWILNGLIMFIIVLFFLAIKFQIK